MSTLPSPAPTPRRAYRDSQDPMIGGVASGLATHLGVPVLWVRAAFVLTTVVGFFGLLFYAGLWLVLPSDSRFPDQAPGLDSATRGGRRPGRIRRLGVTGPGIVLAVLGIGILLSVQAVFGFGWLGGLIWPLVMGAVGIALLWRQADEAQRERWLDGTVRVGPLAAVFGSGGWAAYSRVISGALLILSSLLVLTLTGGSAEGTRELLLAVLLGVLGLVVVAGPWFLRLSADLSSEREERIRSQERADVAAHLHDSVLQTLALIQKSPGDAATVARLARAQERDLRAWLYVGEAMDETTIASALRSAAAEVEDSHGISVDVVTVGDCDHAEGLRPIVAAAREAVTNAGKHAGTGRVDVYAEITDRAVDVFVRDRGVGFDPDQTPEDRHGVRHSIIDRMERHGGTAEIRSTIGEGTEVRLHLPRSPQEEPA